MYQLDSTCGAHDVIYFGLFWITTIVPGGASGVRLEVNYPNICV